MTRNTRSAYPRQGPQDLVDELVATVLQNKSLSFDDAVGLGTLESGWVTSDNVPGRIRPLVDEAAEDVARQLGAPPWAAMVRYPEEVRDRAVEELSEILLTHQLPYETDMPPEVSRMSSVREARDYERKDYRKHTRGRRGSDEEAVNVYIADLAAYNAGRLVGNWVTLPMDEDELKKITDKLSRGGSQDIAIHDYEAPFKISEYDSVWTLNEFLQEVEDSDVPLWIVAYTFDHGGYPMDHSAIEAAQEADVIEADGDPDDLAYAYIERLGDIENAVANPEYYFNYASFGGDLRVDLSATYDEGDESDQALYDSMSDRELGEWYVHENMGGIEELGSETISMYFDYDAFGNELAVDFDYSDGHWISLP